ncbi:hypothetical protein DM01DRAFT_1308846 [Hesseltinella vesiculosa]|uniref:Restriction of telomere capping protein 4 n=1 Tax=Hesseltinella vesiculosa TaxID=101127 RepID=A0A1X2GAS1_9FUNG|nr:hypothetical protein DM01DRAFT_1308846 [Hesseltinella vesiculosa]
MYNRHYRDKHDTGDKEFNLSSKSKQRNANVSTATLQSGKATKRPPPTLSKPANSLFADLLSADAEPKRYKPSYRPKEKLPTKPKKLTTHRPTQSTETAEMHARIQSKSSDTEISTVTCPYCGEDLNTASRPAVPSSIQTALDKIQAADAAHTKLQNEKYGSVMEKRTVHHSDRFAFCQLHQLELVIKPLGQKRGYPLHLDFTTVAARVRALRSDLEKIIDNRIPSPFKDKIIHLYQTQGKHKTRKVDNLMSRFDESMPGYYGPQGSSEMLKVLQQMFLKETDFLTKEKAHPQQLTEYLQQVLVPEAGVRLIQQDKKLTFSQALVVMEKSREFGGYMYPFQDAATDDLHSASDEDNSDDDDIQSMTSQEDE